MNQFRNSYKYIEGQGMQFPDRIPEGSEEFYMDQYVINLLELDAADTNNPDVTKLKKRIEQNNSTVRIMVHPFFELHELHNKHKATRYNEEYLKANPNIKLVEEGTKEMLATDGPENPPIIIFEVAENIEDMLREVQESLKKSKTDLYVVPTYTKSIEPKPEDVSNVYYQLISRNVQWEKLIKKLQQIGVKNIVIGGMDLGPEDPFRWHNLDFSDLEGCVGRSVDILQKDFHVEISELAHPLNREEIKNSGPNAQISN